MKNRSWFVSIILMLAFCAYLFFYFYETERERKIAEIVSHQKIHAKQAARSFYELVDKWNSVLFYLSKDRNIITLNDEGKGELESLFRVFKDEIAGITRTDKNGIITHTIPFRERSIGADISSQKHMVKILSDHKPVISDVFFAVQGYQAIVIHYPIFKDGKYDGSIAFLLNFERIAKEILDEITIGASARAWMISSEGIELYCMNKEHIGKSAFETAGSSEDVKRLAQLMVKGKEGIASFVFYNKEKGDLNSIAYYLPVKINNTFWSLAIATSEEELAAPLFSFSMKLLVVFAFLFAFGVYMANYLLKAREIVKEAAARKKAEEELKLSEERHRLISEVASDYVFATSVSEEGNIAHDWVSGAFSSMTEYTFEEYKKNGGWLSTIYPEDVDKDCQSFAKLKQNQPTVEELRIITKSGKILWVRVFAHPVWDEKKNRLAGIYGAVQNITESKSAETALRNSEERFRAIFNSVSDAMFVHDINTGAILEVNATMERMFGFSKEETLQADIGMMSAGFSPFTQKEALSWMLKARDEGPQIFEWLAKTKSGTLLWVEVSMNLVQLEGKRRLLASVRNISERKRFEEQLETLRLAMDQSPASIVITSAKGIIEYVNAGFCHISGHSSKELIGARLRILNEQKEMDVDRKEIWRSLHEGKEWRSEHTNKRKDGSIYWESTLISPVKNAKGEILHLLAVQENITNRKQSEKQLLEAKEKAEEMSRLKSNFLSNMSHELRTPLVGMLGLSELLYNELAGENREFAGMINRSSNRLLDTLNTLLNYSKIDSGKVILNFSRVSVLSIVREEIKLFGALALKNSLYINEEFRCGELSVVTDQSVVKEIIDNLLSNAIRFTFKGGITVSVDRTVKGIKISIKDTGIGIPEEKVKVIFEEFRQVSEGKGRNFEGTGLGLTIVKKYIGMLKGSIEIESKLDIGSNFTITIPANEVIEEGTTNVVSTFSSVETIPIKSVISKYDVLLVEDDEINSFAISQMLRGICNVHEVNNAEDAIKRTNSKRFDIILMDINLRRGMSGVEAAQAIRKNASYVDTPIAALTAYAMPEDRTEFLNVGFTHYLSKPFTKEQITEMVRLIISELGY